MRCTVRTKKTLVFGIGGGMLVVGVFLGGFMSMIVDSILKSQLVLSEGSTSYNNWIELPIPMYMEFYIFNVSNAAEYEQDPTIKPNLVEMGPYVYREYHKRNITAWNDNETVTFQNIRTWYFDEKNSVGPEDDLVTTINVVPAHLRPIENMDTNGLELRPPVPPQQTQDTTQEMQLTAAPGSSVVAASASTESVIGQAQDGGYATQTAEAEARQRKQRSPKRRKKGRLTSADDTHSPEGTVDDNDSIDLRPVDSTDTEMTVQELHSDDNLDSPSDDRKAEVEMTTVQHESGDNGAYHPSVLNYMSRNMSTGKKLVVSSLLDITNETMFVTKSVRELMFDGYFDLLLNFTNELSLPIPFEEFGYFVDRNGSETYDGVFNMYTGESNLDLLGTVANWNYMNETPYFDSPCNKISGTTGELWAPIKSTADVGIFAPDVCSSLELRKNIIATLKMKYSGEAEIHGLRGYGYLLSDDVFNASSAEGACFCLAGKDCAPAGLMNASACRFNAPVFVSRPHFLLSDPSLGAAVQGLQPDPDKHNFTLGIEPFTGIPLYVNARLMLNVMLEPVELISFYEKLPGRIYFPAFWFNQKAVLTEDLAMLAKFIKNASALGMGLFFGMAGIGLIMVFVGGILTLCHRWKDS
ncbi:protein croquemort-like [Schistocerca cancellata]|uniref:protein croquemort-like n=1 Tax=Schistocerca cancellata TaxID=274614 RepID=UPI00211912B3|nr:protein croquemort-like [Schistocerca cancellata]